MVVRLLDADGLAGEEVTEVDLVAIKVDAAAGGDGDGLVVNGGSQALADLGRAVVRGCSTRRDRPWRAPGAAARY